MENFLEEIKNTNSKLLKSEISDFKQWSNLKHTKKDLNLLLTFNIVELKFKSLKSKKIISGIFSSNPILLETLKLKIENVKKNLNKFNFKKIKIMKIPKENFLISFDLKNKNLTKINLEHWNIVNFLTIKKENILILNEILRKLF